jgi:hypothetical protein
MQCRNLHEKFYLFCGFCLSRGCFSVTEGWNDLCISYLFTYLRTELSLSWEAANCAAIQKIPSNFKEREGSSPCSQEPSTGL